MNDIWDMPFPLKEEMWDRGGGKTNIMMGFEEEEEEEDQTTSHVQGRVRQLGGEEKRQEDDLITLELVTPQQQQQEGNPFVFNQNGHYNNETPLFWKQEYNTMENTMLDMEMNADMEADMNVMGMRNKNQNKNKKEKEKKHTTTMRGKEEAEETEEKRDPTRVFQTTMERGTFLKRDRVLIQHKTRREKFDEAFEKNFYSSLQYVFEIVMDERDFDHEVKFIHVRATVEGGDAYTTEPICMKTETTLVKHPGDNKPHELKGELCIQLANALSHHKTKTKFALNLHFATSTNLDEVFLKKTSPPFAVFARKPGKKQEEKKKKKKREKKKEKTLSL